MSGKASPTPEEERRIRALYAERGADGKPRYSIQDLIRLTGRSGNTITRVVKKWGLRRYMTHGSAA